jgi:HPt (histidine-containing phosphotransfer) domain-containing protein
LARTEGDSELLRKLVDTFLEVCPGRMQEIHTALARGDVKAVEHAAHSLKSSLGALCSNDAFRTAASLEQMARNGDLSLASEVCGALEEDVGLFRQALGKVVEEAERPSL